MKNCDVSEGNEIRCPELFKDKKSNGYSSWLDYEMWLISQGNYTSILKYLSDRKGSAPAPALASMLGTYCGLYIRAYLDNPSFYSYPDVPDLLLEADDLFEKGFGEEEKSAFWQGFDDRLALKFDDYKVFVKYILKMGRFHLSHLLLHRFFSKLTEEQNHLSSLGLELLTYDEFCHGLRDSYNVPKPDFNDKYEDVPFLPANFFNKEEMSILSEAVKSDKSSEGCDEPKIIF